MTENGDHSDEAGGLFTQPMRPQQPSAGGYVAPIPPLTDWNATQWDPTAHGTSPATQWSSTPVPLRDPRQQAPYPAAPTPDQQAPYPAPPTPDQRTPFQQAPYPQQQVNVATTVIVAGAPKSVGIALLLTFFFGPLGMLYSTVAGAVVMVLVNLLVGLLTYGFGLFLTWPICMIWAATAASSRNARAGAVRVVSSR